LWRPFWFDTFLTCTLRHHRMKTAALAGIAIIGVIIWGAISGYADAAPGADEVEAQADAEPAADLPPSPSVTPEAQTVERGSTGCKRHAAAGTATNTLESGSIQRTYRIHVPPVKDPEQPLPMVLNFHGRGGSGAAIEGYSGLLTTSDREGFLLVSPDGTGSPAGWSAGASLPGWKADDIQFGKDLITAVEENYCVDPARIYAVGHSNGAFMASRLACDLPGQIAAIVPVAGLYMPAEGCAAPVPVLALHGTADDVVPFAGGPVRGTYRYPGTRRAIADWAAADGCSGMPTSTRLSARITLERQSGCTAPVELLLIERAGHGWPGMPNTDLASEIDTAPQ
jgi:polyhydroxybutyrate depolymerase